MIPMYKLGGRLGNQMFQYAYLYSQMRKGEISDVYVQSEEYFGEYVDAIKALYSPGIPETRKRVSIHVRRGDYVNNPFYVDLFQTDYYQKAMEMFPNQEFIIFSDDIAWCRRQPIFKDCLFADGDEVSDMNQMAACEHNIMANSSFSWWAAYLNPNPDKKVICPKDWFTDGVERTKCPDEWIRI